MKFILLFCFFGFVATEKEAFKTKASITFTYIIPIFSNGSHFTDFNNTLNFVLKLNYNPNTLCIYSAPNTYSCDNEIFNNATVLSHIYSYSKTFNSSADWIENAESATPRKELCNIYGNCNGIRYNFIILSDFLINSTLPESYESDVKQIFYFIVLSKDSECTQDFIEDNNVICFNVIKDKPTNVVNNVIYEPIIYYIFDPTTKMYNFFVVLNETDINDFLYIAMVIQYYDYFRSQEPILFVAAIQKNDTYFYESVAVLTNTGLLDLQWSIQNFVYSNSTKLSTKLVEKYLKNNFAVDNTDEYYQWNVVITSSFPFWIKNTNIIFDFIHKNIDVYICSPNNTDSYSENLNDLSNHINDIILDDVNVTLRPNHIMVFDSVVDLLNNQQYLPTGKFLMPTKLVKYENQNTTKSKWWIWLIVGCSFAFVLIIALIAFLLWRRRMYRIIAEKYTWALQAGFTHKEAEIIIEKGKELFIDDSFVQVDFQNIKGKGSSAIVYGGFINTISPITILHPCLETKSYANCKVAIKIVNKYGKDDYEQIFREVEAGMKLGWHRHICCLLGWSIHQSTPALIYESIDGGDLYSWIKGFKSEMIPEKQILQILWQISDGMEFISSAGIVHKDLAARNILLTTGFVAKITDFGLASACDESFTYQAPVQRRLPIRWMAPETLTDRLFSEASDCWSFAVLAWEIFNKGSIPYGNIDGNDILEYLNSGKRLELPDGISEEWKELLNNCWKINKDERPSFKNIKQELTVFLEKFTQNYGYLAVTE